MGDGATLPKRRKTDIIGNNLSDPFYDSYEDESLACCVIIDKIVRCDGNVVNINFNKVFLKKIVHSHLLKIQEIEIATNGIKYAH